MQILPLIICIFLASVSHAQGPYTLGETGLKGKVKSVETKYYTFNEKGDTLPNQHLYGGFKYFSEDGRLVRTEAYNAKGKPEREYSYHYYKNAVVIKETFTSHHQPIQLTDSSGQTQSIVIEADNYIELLDSAGKIIFSSSVSLASPEQHTIEQLVEASTYLYTFYVYNSKGLLMEDITYEPGGYLNYKNIYKYDDKGRKTEQSIARNDTAGNRKYVYQYNKNGQVSKETVYKNNEITEEYEFVYVNGQLKRRASVGYPDRTVTVSEYNYKRDNFDNIISKVTLYNGSPESLEEIKITYYE